MILKEKFTSEEHLWYFFCFRYSQDIS